MTTPRISSNELNGEWYIADGYHIAMTELKPEGIKCGAEKYIWMNDTLPIADGMEHNQTVCIADPDAGKSCALSFQIQVKNCSSRIMYKLDTPPLNNSAYCFEFSKTFDPCSISSPKSIPNIEKRREIVNISSVNDNDFVSGWYTSGLYEMITHKISHGANACGTTHPIYLTGGIPDEDGEIHLKEACIAKDSDDCKYKQFIHIKNCGSHRMYHLTPTTVPDSAYCYDFFSDSNEPPPSFTPTFAKVEPDLRWDTRGDVEVPQLIFRCSFGANNAENFYYKVFFYVDGTFVTPALTVQKETAKEAFIKEKDKSEYKLGITISCVVGASSSKSGKIGNLLKSEGFYAGLKMVNTTVSIPRGGNPSTVYFYPTVPYGCYNNLKSILTTQQCEIQISLISKTTSSQSCSNKLGSTGKCSTKITGMTKSQYTNSDQSDKWKKTYPFVIKNTDSQKLSYSLQNRHFKFQLETPNLVNHDFWKEETSEEITVNIYESEEDSWKGQKCQMYCDPHMKTFDGVRYELQFKGQSVAYQHKSLPIEVQVDIDACYRNGRSPYCVCGLTVIAGRDVFQISTCNGHHTIDYELCEDGLLKAVTQYSNTYRIYLPTGAKVEARKRGNNWDVDIRPTVHEVNSVSGLCGSLDGNKCNDMNPKPPSNCNGGYSYHPDEFSRSHSVKADRNFLRIDSDGANVDFSKLQSYPAAYQVCVCPRSTRGRASITDSYAEAECSYRDYATCNNDKREITCALHNIRARRRRRSAENELNISFNDFSSSSKQRGKRSITSMNETEARYKCESALRSSQTYEICNNLGVDASDEEIENCMLDLMLSNDESWINAAEDRSSSSCLEEISNNATLQDENENLVSLVQNITCPNNCSNRGSCNEGICVCDEGFASDDCSFNMSAPLNINGLSNAGLCDLKHNCDTVFVDGEEFPSDRQYKCQFKMIEVTNNSTRTDEVIYNITGFQRTLFQLECSLPKHQIQNETFALEYEVAVQMDEQEYSNYMPFVVIDTTCQDYDSSSSVQYSMKKEYCFIAGRCVPHREKNTRKFCHECNYQENLYDWHPSSASECIISETKENKDKEDHTAKIVAGVIGAVVVVMMIVTAFVVHSKFKNGRNDDQDFPERSDNVSKGVWNDRYLDMSNFTQNADKY